jgi:hypothetical protein
MTRLQTAGAETGALSTEDILSTGTISIQSSLVRSGAFAFSVSDAVGSTYIRTAWTFVASRWFMSRCWIRVVPPTSGNEILLSLVHNTTAIQNYVLASDGNLYRGSVSGTLVATLTSGQWYCFELGLWCDSTTQRQVILRINGSQVDNVISTNSLTLPGNTVRFGMPGSQGAVSGRTIAMDDVALNDDTGSENNSWPDVNGQIVLLAPSSNESVGTNWKGGAGGEIAPNHYDRVNNAPPLGQASAGSDGVQIRDAVASSVQNADFRLPSYQSVIGTDKVVTVVQSVCSIARTGTASSQTGLISNPSETTITVNPSAAGPGTFPSSAWITARGATLNKPTVDQTVGPVLRVNKASGSSGTSYCCQAVLQVEYEPIPVSGKFLAVA